MFAMPAPARWRPAAAALGVAAACLLLWFPSGEAALLRPLEGAGNFHSAIDVANRLEADGTASVIVLIGVANRDLTFRAKGGRFEGRLGVEVELTGDDGRVAREDTEVKLVSYERAQMESPTVYQIVPLVLRGVTARSGRLAVRLEDKLRERPGLIARLKKNYWARSEALGDWYMPEEARAASGLTLGDPVFLAKAPIPAWAQEGIGAAAPEKSLLTDFLHPNRRYGLEQPRLQVYFEAEAPLAAEGGSQAGRGIFMQVLAKDLALALWDTVRLDERQVRQLEQGGTTGIFYDLDLKDLPPGSYQLSAAPASGEGRPWVAEFDVIWSAASLNRYAAELLGEGRVVLTGDALREFEEASQAEQEMLLDKFWRERDPDPTTPVNEAYLEFRRRVSYVREYMGGFNSAGAVDPRGQVYLLLGPPDEIQKEVLPVNEDDQQDAINRVWDGYSPERPGLNIKVNADAKQTAVYQSRRELLAKQRNIGQDKGFELWIYDTAGVQLFPNQYSAQMLGLRFLFVDRTGVGAFVLESTNAMRSGG